MAKQTPQQGNPAKKNKKEQTAKDADQKAVSKQAKSDKDQKKSAKGGKQAPKKETIFRKIVNYFKNVRQEIKRTTWPTRDEVLRMSLIVVGALIFFGVFIFLIDWAMTHLVDLYSQLGDNIGTDSATPVEGDTSTDGTATDADSAATEGEADATTDTSESEGTE